MSSTIPPVKARGSRLLAIATALLVAGSGAAIAPTAANAVPVPDSDVISGQLNWGTVSSWQNYIAGNVAGPNPTGGVFFGNGASSNGTAPNANYDWGTGSTGFYNEGSQQGSIDVPGTVQWTFPTHTINATVSNVTVEFDFATRTGEVLGDFQAKSRDGADLSGQDAQLATFTIPAAATAVNGQISVADAPAIGGADIDRVLGGSYAGKEAMDVSFTANYAAPVTATSVTLQADKASTDVNTDIVFTATVSPADAAGTVQFRSNDSALGAPVAVANGTAVATARFATAGTQSVTAEFIPANAATHGVSVSNATDVTVTVPDTAVATTLTIDPVAPENRTALGSEVTLSATVAQNEGAAVPAGKVKFFSNNEAVTGSDARTLVGEVAIVDGVATLSTTALAAGGHTFSAEYVPANAADFKASTAELVKGIGIFDTTSPAFCSIPSGQGSTSEVPASLTWAWSDYANFAPPFPVGSTGWVKTSTGDITVDGNNFVFSGGEVVANGNCAIISFTGTAKVTAYNDPYTEITNPEVVVSADGSAALRASVTSKNSNGPLATSNGVVTIAQFAAGSAFVPGNDVDSLFASKFDGTVPAGSWSPGYTGAWANSFVSILDPSQQAFYYRTGDSASQNRKPAAPLDLAFNWPAVSTMELVASPKAPVVAGTATTLTATVKPAADVAGAVTFKNIPAGTTTANVLGTANVQNGVATFTGNLPAGGHTFVAEFVSTNAYSDASASIDANYGVAAVSNAASCVISESDAKTYTGFSTRWGWSAYGNDKPHTGGGDLNWPKYAAGNISVDGTDFVLANGTAKVTEDCFSVSFEGTMRVEAYQGFFPTHGQWIEIVNPVLSINSDGNGTWSGGVRTGTGELGNSAPVNTVIATLSDAKFPVIAGEKFTSEIELDYADTVAPGTWAVKNGSPFTSAWANGFVLQVPDMIKSFYYASGAQGDSKKAPLPLTLDWQAKPPTAEIVGGASAVMQGETITFRAQGFVAGADVNLTVQSDPLNLGNSVASNTGVVVRDWRVPADFPEGRHTAYLTTDVQSVSIPFTVEKRVVETAPAPQDVCVANAVTGGSMNWGLKESFRNYANGPIAKGSFSGGSFAVTGGSVNVAEGGIGRIDFAGTIAVNGHNGKLQFNLSSPTVQITGNGTGVLFANVSSTKTTGETAMNGRVAFANLSFAGPAINGGSLAVTGASAVLTAQGAQAFGGFYQAGSALDPITFTATLGGEVACDNTTDPVAVALAATGSQNNVLALTAGMGILTLLVGAGFLLARRRMSVISE